MKKSRSKTKSKIDIEPSLQKKSKNFSKDPEITKEDLKNSENLQEEIRQGFKKP
jgi:hypothetical protein